MYIGRLVLTVGPFHKGVSAQSKWNRSNGHRGGYFSYVYVLNVFMMFIVLNICDGFEIFVCPKGRRFSMGSKWLYVTKNMITPVVVARGGSVKVKSCKDDDGAQGYELSRPTT